jgi:hypothetical protein
MFEKIPHNTSRCDHGEKNGLMYAGDIRYGHDESRYALSKEDAKLYARKHKFVFIEGSKVLERWEQERSSR